MRVEGGQIRRPGTTGGDGSRIERGIVMIGMLGALAFVPWMITWWMAHGWPPYPETYFVGLVVLPAAIFGAAKLLAIGVGVVRRYRASGPR